MQLLILKMSKEDEELMNVRASALICSLTASKKRFEEKRAIDEAARQCYDEACLLDTESDDWETAHEAVAKFERIEQEYIAAAPLRQKALLRLGWEMREARKAGVTI
jgi:outer membrane protein assembly factor BamD (BamD/ComL family)